MLRTVSKGISPTLLFLLVLLVLLPAKANAFGAGNIASISTVEGKNWRHGDIEDTIKALAFIKGHKWTSTMIKRVYFGNWLRDYSQAMDVGTLKNLQADTIRVLVWVLSFMSFGFATAEFEVTADRLGVYRPEEHIDNPKDYADNEDARQYDKRLRPPIRPIELEIDPQTGMKNYIANERGDWATSAAYVKYSMSRSIHYGRMYTSGGGDKGKEEDLCEALRCLGQGLHTLEDFGAHSNYCELSLREMGMLNVFPHVGTATQINLHGHHVFPLVTGTFGMVDFFHSVLGEANDHFAQSELNEADNALLNAENNSGSSPLNALTGLLGKVPGTKELVSEAEELKERSEAQAELNRSQNVNTGYTSSSRGFDDPAYGSFEQSRAYGQEGYGAPQHQPPQTGGGGSERLQGLQDFDPQKTVNQIYPILQFRDKVVRRINSIIEKIPGLEALVEKITETVTLFVFSLLAPFIRPLIKVASKSLQTGSLGVVESSGKHQYEVWSDPHCSDPTHSMLSKDHFANILNEPAGQVASAILRYVVPRVIYAWQHVDVPVDQVLDDCLRVFHHPAVRDMNNEAHRTMFEAVDHWVKSRSDHGHNLNDVLSAEAVKVGKNLKGSSSGSGQGGHGHSHGGGGFPAISSLYGGSHGQQQQSQHHQSSGSSLPWNELEKLPIPGLSNVTNIANKFGGFGNLLSHGVSGLSRDQPEGEQPQVPTSHQEGYESHPSQHQYQDQAAPPVAHGYDPPFERPQYEPGFHLPPPSGYEQYHGNFHEGREYQAPESGSHTYEYHEHHEQHQGGGHGGHHHSHSHSHGHEHGHSHSHQY
ncbi:HET-C domain protein HetC [Talaromyces proteolyticus]|uniref:HET-C domain protein HetC n=1 Tax=Talaromyces proteolyticus TaxID=1131652 RepID=A0AAD4KND0_9EURO|nr:HET-C domain protein HetC [Talaromyces proteolyticus]KAH8696627.1 HET-C domain protein HetC [Talaromyces proteolyticus]